MTLLTVTVLVALTMAGRALQTSWKEERYRRRRRKRVVPGGEGEAERVARTEAKGECRREGAEGLGSPGGVGGSSSQDDGGLRGDERDRRGRVPEPEPGSAGTRTDSTSTVASASAPIWRKRRVCRKSPRK